jgi:hypothetical protein
MGRRDLGGRVLVTKRERWMGSHLFVSCYQLRERSSVLFMLVRLERGGHEVLTIR